MPDQLFRFVSIPPWSESDFERAAKPLMQYLAENYDPHTKVIVDSVRAELVSGVATFRTEDFIKD